MRTMGCVGFCVALILCALDPILQAAGAPAPDRKIILTQGWAIQSSAKVGEKGDVLSSSSFQPQGWYAAEVPTTVVAALVRDKVYPDPYFGMNLRAIPGTTYPIGENFSNLPMPVGSPFAVPWWYRTQFQLPAEYRGQQLWLHFSGINYRANVWLNGKPIASSDRVAGAWRIFEFNITAVAEPGKTNVLAVEVFPPMPHDLAITFVDWNPLPPDKEMGLWREVYISASGPVAVRYPHVISKLDLPAADAAHLTVTAEVMNPTSHPVKGVLKGAIETSRFSQPVELRAQESKEVVFTPEQFPQLNLAHPRLWWPAQMGTPNLYQMNLEFEVDGKPSERTQTSFGIREVSSEMNQKGYRLFRINGRRILIRGGGWASDMLLRHDAQNLEDQIRYTRDMGLNTIRLEGKLETDDFFELADRYGILIMAGWCCCDHWEQWNQWKQEDFQVAPESLRDQIRRLQNHPSLLVWLNGSDNPPPPDVEQSYLAVLKQCRWQNPYLSSATADPTPVTGESGVKMTGPYEYVPPSYWDEDEKHGGAYGFNTETSPGAAVPPVESLRKMLPEDKLWPINEVWNYHAGGGEFKDIQVYAAAQNARYGPSSGVDEFAEKSQLMAYEGIRAMFEEYSRGKYVSTGVIQWMLNNAWPSVIWHLYDFYLKPAGGYFGAKKACQPLHPQYSYHDHSVVVVNSQYADAKGLKLIAKIYNLDMREKFSREMTLDVPADSSTALFDLPTIEGLSPTYFLRLTLQDATGKGVSSNFYWLSTKPEILDWEKSTWHYTPTKSYADYTALRSLPRVKLKSSSQTEHQGEEDLVEVSVENPTPHLAFLVRLKVAKGKGGDEVLPILWQDNYFELMPGEKRQITARFRARDLRGTKPVVEVSGWNVE